MSDKRSGVCLKLKKEAKNRPAKLNNVKWTLNIKR